jgi:hypothetical protein
MRRSVGGTSQVTARTDGAESFGLSAVGGDLSRRALEALALEEYRSGHLTEAELQKLLGFGTRC